MSYFSQALEEFLEILNQKIATGYEIATSQQVTEIEVIVREAQAWANHEYRVDISSIRQKIAKVIANISDAWLIENLKDITSAFPDFRERDDIDQGHARFSGDSTTDAPPPEKPVKK